MLVLTSVAAMIAWPGIIEPAGAATGSFLGVHEPVWYLNASEPYAIGGPDNRFSYDGSDVRPLSGNAKIRVNAEKDLGIMQIQVRGTIHPAPQTSLSGQILLSYRVDRSGPEYQEGGIADFVYAPHPDATNPLPLPPTRAYLAVWGRCDVEVNGTVVYQDLPGLILCTEGSRGEEPRALYNQAGTEFYQPQQPDDYAPARPQEAELHVIAYSEDSTDEQTWIYLYFDEVRDLRPGSCTLGACRD
jgi:hypothetical protein